MQKTEVNLDELIRETLAIFRRAETNERNMAWTIHALPAVRADRALLRLLLVNLISNMVKFTIARTGPLADEPVWVRKPPGSPQPTLSESALSWRELLEPAHGWDFLPLSIAVKS
jgi:hypothetical protein